MNAEIRDIRTAAELALAAHFGAAKELLPGTAAIAALRENAFHRFERAGLPNRRVEEWKYTDLRALMREAKPLASPPAPRANRRLKDKGGLLASIEARRIVFVDGVFAPERSDLADLESGLAITSMAKTLASGDTAVTTRLGNIVSTGDIAVALNTAFMRDGAVIKVAPGTELARPLHLLFLNEGKDPAAVFLRSLVLIGENAKAMVVESHEGSVANQINTALELKVGDGAHVDHVKITAEGAGDLHLSTMMAAIGGHARFNEFLFTAGASVVRNQLFVRFEGEGTVAAIRGASLLKGRQHADTTLVADHVIGGCTSRELFKSVVDDEARCIFQGKIIVQPHAQKTDAKMATHALLLSDSAETDNKPELEIFADDVQCGHGATSGSLDEDLLFYLRARGIPAKEAEALLIQAFVGEAVEGIEHAGLRDCLMEQVVAWVRARN
jgi:Fe-S cluster assembly protein SufD